MVAGWDNHSQQAGSRWLSKAVLRNRVYYSVKPFIPRSLRTALRRRLAVRLRQRFATSWPIMPGSEQEPAAWSGWPDGKKFALVLTHDVEGPSGLAKCRRLAELERELSFRSSFNFIPEGDYRVSSELRQELVSQGFEVGVHDLRHDGRLYQSRRDFDENARRVVLARGRAEEAKLRGFINNQAEFATRNRC